MATRPVHEALRQSDCVVFGEDSVLRLADRGHRGLFIHQVERAADRLILRVYTSRAITSQDLRQRLRPRDSFGTEYEVAMIDPDPVDGNGVVEFTPAPPADVVWLQLEDQPGRALTVASCVGP